MKSIFALSLLFVGARADDLFAGSPLVKNATPEEFETITNKLNQAVVATFYKSEGCTESAKFAKEFESVGTELKAGAHTVAFDCATYPEDHGCDSIKRFPVVKFYVKGKASEYTGSFDYDSISSQFKEDLPADGIVKLEQKKKKYKKYLETHRDRPIVVLFNHQKTPPPILRIINLQFGEHVHVVEVRKTDRKISREFGIKDFPKFGILPTRDVPVDDDDDDDLELEDELVLFPGEYKLESIVQWVGTYAPNADLSCGLEEKEEDIEPLPLEQLTDESCLEALCRRGGLCAVLITSVDPVKPNREQLKQDVSVLKMVQDARKDDLFNFAWIDGVSQMEFIDKAFHLTPQDYPQMVIIASSKKRYATFVGSYAPQAVGNFLDNIKSGKIKTSPISTKEWPTIEGYTARCEHMEPPPIKEIKLDDKEAKEDQRMIAKSRGFRKGGIPEIEHDDFQKLVMNSKANWLLFLSLEKSPEGEAGAVLKEYKKAAKALKNTVRFGTIDCSNEKNLELVEAKFGLTFDGEKTFYIIDILGGDKIEKQNIVQHNVYTGELTGKALKNFAQEMIRESTKDIVIPTVYTQSLQQYLYGKDVFHRRVLLLTESSEVPLLWRAIALEYQDDDIFFGVSLNGDISLQEAMQATTFPAVMYLQGVPGEKDENEQTSINLQTAMHIGKIEMKSLTQNLDQMMMQWQVQQREWRAKYGGALFGEPDEDDDRDYKIHLSQ